MINIDTMHVEKANCDDHLIITKITKKSKAHWGYSDDQMRLWDDELTVKPQDFDRMQFYKLIVNSRIIAYYAYNEQSASSIKLESLFVLPGFIGLGLGKLLLSDLMKRLQRTSYQKIILDADPHAEEFYLKQGFKIIGQKKTSIKNRYMPIMEKPIGT